MRARRCRRLRTVAVLQVSALLELVIADAVHVVIAVGLVAAYLFQLTAEVVGVFIVLFLHSFLFFLKQIIYIMRMTFYYYRNRIWKWKFK